MTTENEKAYKRAWYLANKERATQLTFKSREDLERWIADNAAADVAELARVAYANMRRFYNGDWNFKTFLLLRRHGSDDESFDAIDAAEKEWTAANLKAEREREEKIKAATLTAERRRRRERADEKRAAEEKAERAENVRTIIDKLRVSERYAYTLMKYGTTLPDMAKQIADAIGGEASDYLRARSKPGRKVNYVGVFMRPRFWDASFQEFTDDPEAPLELAGGALEAFERLKTTGDNFTELEEVLAIGIDADTARRVWRAYKLWRIKTISDLATAQVQEEAEQDYNFG